MLSTSSRNSLFLFILNNEACKASVVLPVGRAYQLHANRVLNNWTLAQQEAAIAKELEASRNDSPADLGDQDDDGVGEEPESRYLLELDPRDWKVYLNFISAPPRIMNF